MPNPGWDALIPLGEGLGTFRIGFLELSPAGSC